jgi:hypothetical protein
VAASRGGVGAAALPMQRAGSIKKPNSVSNVVDLNQTVDMFCTCICRYFCRYFAPDRRRWLTQARHVPPAYSDDYSTRHCEEEESEFDCQQC